MTHASPSLDPPAYVCSSTEILATLLLVSLCGETVNSAMGSTTYNSEVNKTILPRP